jgi:glucose/mannose-6-phosphate isomerase
MLRVLENAGTLRNVKSQVAKVSKALENPALAKQADKLAEKLQGKVPLIFSSTRMGWIAYRWQTQLNENSKIHAFHHVFPELNHNMIVGFTKLNADFHAIILEDQDDHRRIKKRMEITRRLIRKQGVDSTMLDFTDPSLLVRMMSMIHLGDLTSYFLSQYEGIDPVPVDIVESLKKELGPSASKPFSYPGLSPSVCD